MFRVTLNIPAQRVNNPNAHSSRDRMDMGIVEWSYRAYFIAMAMNGNAIFNSSQTMLSENHSV